MRVNRFVWMAAILACASVGTATTVQEIGAVDLDAAFSASTGVFSVNELHTIAGQGAIISVLYDDTTQDAFGPTGYGDFVLQTTLSSEISGGGTVKGIFTGGSVTLADDAGTTLFTADIVNLTLTRTGIKQLALAGEFNNATISLPSGATFVAGGGIVGGVLNLVNDPVNFQSDLSGTAAINFVPEPTSLLLLTLGGVMPRRRAR